MFWKFWTWVLLSKLPRWWYVNYFGCGNMLLRMFFCALIGVCALTFVAYNSFEDSCIVCKLDFLSIGLFDRSSLDGLTLDLRFRGPSVSKPLGLKMDLVLFVVFCLMTAGCLLVGDEHCCAMLVVVSFTLLLFADKNTCKVELWLSCCWFTKFLFLFKVELIADVIELLVGIGGLFFPGIKLMGFGSTELLIDCEDSE